jgi:hypothetical protein
MRPEGKRGVKHRANDVAGNPLALILAGRAFRPPGIRQLAAPSIS